MAGARSITFYYDIVCPYAFLASRLVEHAARQAGASVVWRPVLLGGLYQKTEAPQGADGSATAVMSDAKRKLVGEDLRRQWARAPTPDTLQMHPRHPVRTLKAMRLLTGTPAAGDQRARLSHALFSAYWEDSRDVDEVGVLAEVAGKSQAEVEQIVESADVKAQLRDSTDEACAQGAFGVPSFYTSTGEFFWGVDRLFLAQRALGMAAARPHRVIPEGRAEPGGVVTLYHDFSSPWSYLAAMSLRRLVDEVAPTAEIEYVPILLGALFKAVGTPIVPLKAISKAKQRWMARDLGLWKDYHGTDFKFTSTFPLRTVTALRAVIGTPDPELTAAIYRAAWAEDRDIGDEAVLASVIEGAGHEPDAVLAKTRDQAVKDQLFANTTRALDLGLCGVPSFQVNGGRVLWGQDRINVVQDILLGWSDTARPQHQSSL